jgi:hypothetical protein
MFLAMVGIFFKRLASVSITLFFTVLGGIRWTLDLIGWATAPDDVETAMTRLDQFFVWLLSVPGWLILVCILISSMWLMRVSWPRQSISSFTEAPIILENPKGKITAAAKDEDIVIEQQARDDLEMFVTNNLLETCYSLIHLQSELVHRAEANKLISEMAIHGLLRRWDLRDFDDGLHALSGFGDSPPTIPTAEELVGGVDRIEKGYPVLCKQGQELAVAIGAEFGKDARLDSMYEEWRNSHNATVEAYEKIKRDPRMRRDEILQKLHRPVRQTRFGSRIPLPQADEKFAIYTP